MKSFSIILLIIIIGSMLVPCTDGENNFSVTQDILVTYDGDHADFDFCSPLCSCHCCHSHI